MWDYCDAQGLTSHGQLGFGVGVMCGKSEVGGVGWGRMPIGVDRWEEREDSVDVVSQSS